MKSRFDKLSELAGGKLVSAQAALSKAGSSTLAVGNAVRQEIGAAIDTSGELMRDAIDHEYTKSAATKAKEFVNDATSAGRKLTNHAAGDAKTTQDIGVPNPDTEAESSKDIEDAIHKLEGRDRLGKLGEGMGTAGGALAGASAAGVIASAAGASTLFGSTTLAGALGGVFVASTPVGWVVGSAALAGAAGYGIAKMIRSGSRQDKVREEIIERLKKRLGTIRGKRGEQVALDELRLLLPVVIKSGLVTEDQAERMITLVNNGHLGAEIALLRIRAISALK
jgi:hypothetical protein